MIIELLYKHTVLSKIIYEHNNVGDNSYWTLDLLATTIILLLLIIKYIYNNIIGVANRSSVANIIDNLYGHYRNLLATTIKLLLLIIK